MSVGTDPLMYEDAFPRPANIPVTNLMVALHAWGHLPHHGLNVLLRELYTGVLQGGIFLHSENND